MCSDFFKQSNNHIECACCHSKVKTANNNAVSINSECPCTAQKSKSGSLVQSSTTPNYLLEELNKLADISGQIYSIIIFEDISYHKIRPKPNIASNNTLESLRTVILLN